MKNNTTLAQRCTLDKELKFSFLEEMFKTVPEAIVMADLDSNIFCVNNEFCRIFEFEYEEVIGRKLYEVVVKKEQTEESKSLINKVLEGESFERDVSRVRKDGTHFEVSLLAMPLKVEGRVSAICGIYRDISERKRSEIELGKSEKRFKLMFESIPDALFLTKIGGTDSGDIIDCNEACSLFQVTDR